MGVAVNGNSPRADRKDAEWDAGGANDSDDSWDDDSDRQLG
jgi:hypothetical protein